MIAVADVSARYGDALLRSTFTDHLARYGDELSGFLFSGLSLGIGVGVVDLTQWLLFVAVLGFLAPQLYPSSMEEITETVPLRLVVGATGTGFAIVMTGMDGLDDVGLLLVLAVVFFVALSAIFRIYRASPYDEDGVLVSGLDQFAQWDGIAQDELERATNYDGWRRSLALGIFAGATYVVLFAPVLVAGVVTTMLAETFPIPDLLVIAYALNGLVAAQTERLSTPPDPLNVEDYLLTFAGHATDGVQSMFVLLLFGFGVFLTVVTPVIVLRPATGLLLLTLRPPILPLLSWNVVGLYVLALSGAAYGLWFWLRMGPRVAAFLERWNDAPRETPFASRPRSLLLPSFLAIAVATAGLSNDFLGENRYPFAVAWPVVTVGVAWVVRRTRRRRPAVARREDLTIVAAVIVAYLTLMGCLAIGTRDPTVLLSPRVGLFCGVMFYAVGVGRVSRYGNRHDQRYGGDTDDERRYALSLYLGIGGLFTLLTAGYVTGALETLVVISGVLLLGFAVVTGLTKYYRL